MLKEKKIGFIGAGQMCEAIFSGVLKSNALPPQNVFLTDVSDERLNGLKEKYGILPLNNKDNAGALEILDKCDIIVLAIKPQMAAKVLQPLLGKISKEKIIVSIVGGVDLAKLENLLGQAQIVRVMPNTPMLVGKGVAGICTNKNVSQESLCLVEEMFSCVGSAYVLDEHLIDPLTGISGCGPAFAYMFIDALADGGVEQGLSRDMAIKLAAQMLVGSGEMVLQTGLHPDKLKDNVCSPAGSTIVGVHSLENNAFRGIVAKAVCDSCEKMKEVGKKA